MRTHNEKRYLENKTRLMEKCYECFSENGLCSVGIRHLGEYCGVSSATLYSYFNNLDDLIIQSTAHCMSKVEDDFLALAPKNFEDVLRFIDEIPYWTAEKHGKKYRLMYQVYTHPKYAEAGKRFFEGVNKRYTEYAKQLEGRIGIPYDITTPLIFILIRACVHYALFEDEYYLKTQLEVLKKGLLMYADIKDASTGNN